MASTHSIPDLVKIQTLATALSNEACWAYVTRPQKLAEITEILAQAYKDITDLVMIYACLPGYCKDYGRCVPCEINPPPPGPGPNPEMLAAARVPGTDGSRRKKPTGRRPGPDVRPSR